MILRQQRGMSLIELTIAMSIMSMIALVMGNFVIRRMEDFAKSEAQSIVQQNTKVAMENIMITARAAQAVESVNAWPDPHGPGGNQHGWTSTSSDPATLVLAVPALDANENPIYADSLHNTLRTNDVIYYVDAASQSLYRRTLANPVSGNAAKTTCPPAQATATCPPDTKVIDKVANLSVVYLLAHNLAAPSPEAAAAIKISLSQSLKKGAKTYSSNITSQASFRN